MMHSRFAHTIVLTLAITLLSSCGWQLRGHYPANSERGQTLSQLKTLRVVSEDRNNAFFRSFHDTLKTQSIELSNDADIRVEIRPESLRRQPLTYGRTGVPAQYQLTLSIEYFSARADNVIVEQRNIISRRDYDFDPNLIIAKDREEQELLTEMRRELSERIIVSIQKAL